MRSRLVTVFVITLTASLAAQAPQPDDLHKPNKDFAAAVNAKDLQRLLASYTDDAVVMPPDGPVVKGKAEIEKFWKGVLDQGMHVDSMTSTGSAGFGTWGYDAGVAELRFAPPAGGSPTLDTVKYITILQRGSDGLWRIVRDIWNSDLPR